MNSSFKYSKLFNTPILFLIFNRPHNTGRVFKLLKKIKPLRLYLAADGPRLEKKGEIELVNKVTKIVSVVEWPCEVKTLFRKKNLGCKIAVSSAINWFFKHEEEGIIIEDDCLPNEDFFRFCQNLLDYHRNNNQVFMISGNNFQDGVKRGDASYFFSQYTHIWGWATWKRAWKYYDRDIKFWPNWKNSVNWKNKFTENIEQKYWARILDKVYLKQLDTWDYSWQASMWKNNGLAINPNVNLVRNIGFGKDATHTTNRNFIYSNKSSKKINKIIHLNIIKKNQEADKYSFNNLYGGRNMRFPLNLLRLPKKIILYFLLKFRLIK
jgi:hypothetical protein